MPTFKKDDDVEIKLNLNTGQTIQTVWALGRVNRVDGDNYWVDYRYQIGRSIWGTEGPTFVKASDIRPPSGDNVAIVAKKKAREEAIRALASQLKQGDDVEVQVEYNDGTSAWVPGTFMRLNNGLFEVSGEQITGDETSTDQIAVENIRLPLITKLAFTPLPSNSKVGFASLKNKGGVVTKYRYGVETYGTPFDTVRDFNFGPNTHDNAYGHSRQFFLSKLPGNQIGVIWQDKDDLSIQLTKIASGFGSSETLPLPGSGNEVLAAATQDPQGNCYYITIQRGQGQPLSAKLYRTDPMGVSVKPSPMTLDTTEPPNPNMRNPSSKQLNVFMFRAAEDKIGMNVADMRYIKNADKGQLGVILSRQRYDKHFGAIALIFDATSLELVSNWGQTSGHSWGNIMLDNSSGDFVGIDLGDNYPRGIHLHRFNTTEIRSRVVYTFKTQHSDTAYNNNASVNKSFPVFTEISGSGKTYYRWSNDNYTYTELGGIVENNDNTYTIVFVGEPFGGKALLNERTGSCLNDPRNIGLVKVKADFKSMTAMDPTASVVTNDVVVTPGITETTKFYSFSGGENQQQNTGVVWLTNYQDKDQANVSRLKAAKLPDGNIWLLWETWTPTEYVNTFAMKVSQTGQKLGEVIELGPFVRLSRQDDLLVDGNTIYAVAGISNEKKLELNVIQLS